MVIFLRKLGHSRRHPPPGVSRVEPHGLPERDIKEIGRPVSAVRRRWGSTASFSEARLLLILSGKPNEEMRKIPRRSDHEHQTHVAIPRVNPFLFLRGVPSNPSHSASPQPFASNAAAAAAARKERYWYHTHAYTHIQTPIERERERERARSRAVKGQQDKKRTKRLLKSLHRNFPHPAQNQETFAQAGSAPDCKKTPLVVGCARGCSQAYACLTFLVPDPDQKRNPRYLLFRRFQG